MALTFGELVRDASASQNAGGIISTSRTFLVPGKYPEDALSDPSLNGLPPTGAQIGSLHPRNPAGQNLKCAGYQLGEIVGNETSGFGYYVTAIYTPQGSSFGGQPPDVTNPLYKTESMTSGVATIPYPRVTRRPILIPFPPAAGPVYFAPLRSFDYAVEWKDLLVNVCTYQITINRTTWTQANAVTVNAETNKIHRFGSTDWRFEGADVNEIYASKIWTVTYRWYAEAPTPQAYWKPLYDTNANQWVDSTNIIAIPARAAFQRWEVTYTPTQGPPVIPAGYDVVPDIQAYIVAIDANVRNDSGYGNLPGYNTNGWTFTP